MIKKQQTAAALGLDARWMQAVDGRPMYCLSGSVPRDWKIPDGWLLVHNHVKATPNARSGVRGWRVWLARPAAVKCIACDCGWESHLGAHYRIDRDAR
jgi:hypothetical protein